MTISLIKVGILTASDRCSHGERKDESGLLLKFLTEERLGAEVVAYRVVPDDKEAIRKVIVHMTDLFFCDLVLTTGGTGLSPRDVTPEATKELIEREIPGISEAIRRQSMKKTKFAMLSRAVAGIRGKTLIINLPGSPSAIEEAFEVLEYVLAHAVALIHGEVDDCRKTLHLLHSHS